jgi:hypothetical protein
MAKNQTQAAEAETQALEADAPQPEETKGQAFVRIAERRTGNAMNAIRLLEGLTNKANYDYTPEHWSAIMGAVNAQVAKLQALVDAGGVRAAAEGGFKLGNPAASTEPANVAAEDGE